MLILVEILCAMIAIFVIGAAVYAFIGLKKEEKKIALSFDALHNGVKNYAKACAIPVPLETDLETLRGLYGSCEESFSEMNAESKRNCLKIREKIEKCVGEYDAAVNAYNERLGTFPLCIVTSLTLRKQMKNFRNKDEKQVIGK